MNFLQPLAAGGVPCLGNQPGQDNDTGLNIGQTTGFKLLPEAPFERMHLVQNINDLPAGVRFSQHVFLGEPAMRRDNGDFENHRNPRDKLLQKLCRGGIQKFFQQSHRFPHPGGRVSPAWLKSHLPQCRLDRLKWRLDRLLPQQIPRSAQCLLQGIKAVTHSRIDQQLLTIAAVQADELIEVLFPLVRMLKQAAREVPVEKTDPVTNPTTVVH